MNRRKAISKITISATGMVVLPYTFVSCEKSDMDPANNANNGDANGNSNEIDLSKPENSALNTTGGFLIFGNIIVINTGNNTFVALSKVCTHNGCNVTYNSSNNNLPCPCHGSLFSIDGSVLNGPASTPLKKYTVTKNGNILTIT